MVEISNRALAYIMIAAMFVTVLSTGATLMRLDFLQAEQVLSGYASNPNATARLNLSATTSIVFRQDVIDWGTGYVNTSEAPNCTLTTIGKPGHLFGCGNFTDVPQPGPLELENNGNLAVFVDLRLEDTPEDWIGSGALAWINASENSSNTGTACTDSLQTAEVPISTSDIRICDNLNFGSGASVIDIGMRVEVPSAAPPGEKSVQLVATAEAAP